MVHQVNQTIERASCGSGLVHCNDEEEEVGEEVDSLNSVIGGRSRSHGCHGTLKLMHWDNNNMSNIKTLKLGGTKLNIQMLQNRQVLSHHL